MMGLFLFIGLAASALTTIRLVILQSYSLVLHHLFFFISERMILILVILSCVLLLKLAWDLQLQKCVWIESIIKQPLICTSSPYEWIGPVLFWFWHHFIHICFNPRLHQVRATPKQISIKLAIDKGKNQVLLAESDKDFVDILFSFLTLPMGTIIRLADKKSGVGCMDYLYKSVEALDEQFFQSKACKSMLLNPRSAHEIHCKNLVVKIDNTEPTKIYTGSKLHCPFRTLSREAHRFGSMVENSECSCGQAMDKEVFLEYQKGITYGHGVFIEETSRKFMITDDLRITPVSMSDSLAMFRKLGLESGNGIEVRTVKVDEEEVMHLLKRLLLSKTPLTDTFLLNEENTENMAPSEPPCGPNHLENKFRKMKVKLLVNKSNRKVLCLEAKEDFMNLILSFLTLPLGSILRLLRGQSSVGSVDNLYESVGSSKMTDFFNSTKSKDLLRNPKLPLHFSLDEQLPVKEEDPMAHASHRCADCFRKNKVCSGSWGEQLYFMNPKLPGQIERGGEFIKKGTLLLINDDLTIQTLSPINGILGLDKLKVPVSNSEEHEVEVGAEEALALLKASLISRSVLNNTFKKHFARGPISFQDIDNSNDQLIGRMDDEDFHDHVDVEDNLETSDDDLESSGDDSIWDDAIRAIAVDKPRFDNRAGASSRSVPTSRGIPSSSTSVFSYFFFPDDYDDK